MKKSIKIKQPGESLLAGVLTAYDDLISRGLAFAEGAYGLLVVSGGPGLSKTTILKTAVESVAGNDFCLVEANASAYATYCRLWRNRNKLVLLDDADGMLDTPQGRRLLKQLCQTEQWRRVSWETGATLGKGAQAPQEFYTSSKVCIISNAWDTSANVHMKAIADRGQCYLFSPSALEVHRYVANWFWDQKVFDHVASVIPFLRTPTCRLYVRAWEQKQAGDDWVAYVNHHAFQPGDPEHRLVELLREDVPNAERQRRWTKEGFGSRATFYRHLSDLKERVGLTKVEHLKVCGHAPRPRPDPTPESEDLGVGEEGAA